MKRILSVLLALVMALGLLTVGASALTVDFGAATEAQYRANAPTRTPAQKDALWEWLKDEKGYDELAAAVQSYIDAFLANYLQAVQAANAAPALAAALAEFEDGWDVAVTTNDIFAELAPAGKQYLRGVIDEFGWGSGNTAYAGGSAYDCFIAGGATADGFELPTPDDVIVAIKGALAVALQKIIDNLGLNAAAVALQGTGTWDALPVATEMNTFSAWLVTYEPNGSSSDAFAVYKQSSSTFAAAAATLMTAPAGKQFKEWNKLANGTGTAYAAGANVPMPATGALTLYAIWENIPTYAVTYNLNSGTGTLPTETAKAAGATFAAAASAGLTAPAGKQFKQWNTKNDGTGTAYAAGATVTMPAAALTLYAIWEDIPATTYAVTYNLNGGTGTLPTETAKAAGATFAAAASTGLTAPSGKQFKQWNTKNDGTGTAYAAGATVTMPANALTLYAIWENIPAATYTLTYNLNYAGAPALAPLTIAANTDFNLVNTYNREGGYYFKGWSLTTTGDPIVGQKIKMTGDITVYAKWEKINQLYHMITRILPANLYDGLLHNFLYLLVKYVGFGWFWQGFVWK